MITYEEFSKMELRAGKILEVNEHPNADKLYVVKVDLGDKQIQVVAGLKAHYQIEGLQGKTAAVLVNLQPRALRGVESQGMILAAGDENGVKILTVDGEVAPGSTIR